MDFYFSGRFQLHVISKTDIALQSRVVYFGFKCLVTVSYTQRLNNNNYRVVKP